MFNFFNRSKSKEAVKDRLKLVLSYDRTNLPPGQMEALKTELLAVVKKYFPSAHDDYDVKLEQKEDQTVLVASLPVQAK